MELKTLWTCLLVLVATVASPTLPDARAEADPAVVEAAAHLLHQCTVTERDGTHNLLLKAVRHLEDPETRPLFEQLATAEHAGLKIHGILGLAEVSQGRQVDLSLIAQIDDPAVQSTIITAAMDDDLLSHDQAAQLLAWDGLAVEVKVLVAIRLLEADKFKDTALLHQAIADAKKLAGGALAALLLMQLDDPAGIKHLQEVVDLSDDPQRDTIRAMLLQSSMRHSFEKCAPWAMSIAAQPDTDPVLRLVALRTSLRFQADGAVELWHSLYQAEDAGAADRMRLALTAMYVSPWASSEPFKTLEQSDDTMLSAIGRAGVQITTESAGIGDAIAELLEVGHPMINNWALDYAKNHASDVDAQVTLLGLILAYEHSPARGKARRLDEAIQATQALFEQYPDVAVKLLRPILTEPGRDDVLNQAILLGLVRARTDQAVSVVEGIESQLTSPDAQGLALLLTARSDRPMDQAQLEQLALLARGGGRLEDSLRIQAAWTYLKRTGDAQGVLRQVLSME